MRTGTYSWRASGEIHHPGGPNIRLGFDFYLSPNGWRIYDITSNGVSAVAALRRQYLANQFAP